MSEEQYYCLTLDDCALPSFISGGKPYYGTFAEIAAFMDALKSDDRRQDVENGLIEAFEAFKAGNEDATHSVAYNETKLLEPVELLGRREYALEGYVWTHMNVWDCPYDMRCDKAEIEQAWFRADDAAIRCVRARFVNLQCKGVRNVWRPITDGMLWGYPHVLVYDGPVFRSRFFVAEAREDTTNVSNQISNLPQIPDLSGICDDIFGDG